MSEYGEDESVISLQDYMASLNRRLSRTPDRFVQLYCRSSHDDFHPLVQAICSSLEVVAGADILHIPETVTSKGQMVWIDDEITAGRFPGRAQYPDGIVPVSVGGFTSEVIDLIKKNAAVSYLKGYYAHTQCQGRRVEHVLGESYLTRVHDFLQKESLKLFVFNVITPASSVQYLNGKTIDPSELAYTSALNSDFSITIPETYTLQLEQMLNEQFSQNNRDR